MLVGAAAWLGSASAAPVGGSYARANNAQPAVWSGCQTSTGASFLSVQADSNLNTIGANVNIRPFFGCTLRQKSHVSQLVTGCFNGFTHPLATVNGTAFADAGILQDCSTRGGGKQSLWYMNAP